LRNAVIGEMFGSLAVVFKEKLLSKTAKFAYTLNFVESSSVKTCAT